MSITIGNTNSVQTNTETASGILMAKKALNQTELEGKMALELIQSASSATTPSNTSPVGNSGFTVNIKA